MNTILLRFEKPVTTIRGREDLRKAIRWALLEYGSLSADEIRAVLNEDFRIHPRFGVTMHMIHFYARGAADEISRERVKHAYITIYSCKAPAGEEEGVR